MATGAYLGRYASTAPPFIPIAAPTMTIAKRFRWEGAHRLPWHQGGCQHLHGHSYELWIEVGGDADARGMVIDFKEVKRVLKPLIEAWDHGTLVDASDAPLVAALRDLDSKYFALPFDSTSENVALYALAYLAVQGGAILEAQGITEVSARLHETETCYASLTLSIDAARRHAAELGISDAVDVPSGDGAAPSARA